MEMSSWQVLAVTSPTAGCGKTVTAANLAFSIARQPERNVLLVDMDLRKPKVAEYLGIKFEHGLMSALEGRASLVDTVVEANCGPYAVHVLPCEGCPTGSAEWMASQAMVNVIQSIRREFRSHIVILDLPPILVGDDVISVLPRVDAALMIGGAGMSRVSDLAECNKHLQGTNVLRFVLNKVPESAAPHYGYY
jgi:Mrp family chromosome partitioning ATPase